MIDTESLVEAFALEFEQIASEARNYRFSSIERDALDIASSIRNQHHKIAPTSLLHDLRVLRKDIVSWLHFRSGRRR